MPTLYTSTQAPGGMVAPAYGVGTSEASVTPVISSAGNLLAQSLIALVATAGGANAFTIQEVGVGAIVDSAATTIGTFTIPNAANSATALILVRSGMTATSHKYDSTRVALYALTITRVAGANAVATLSSVFGAAIATSAAGHTLTTALTLAAVSGAVGASNTIALQVTNIGSVADSTETMATVFMQNALASGITLASA